MTPMNVFFIPALTILNRLRYIKKFLLIGLIFIIPLGVVMYYFISEIDYKIAFTAKEVEGAEVITAAAGLLNHSIQYTGLLSVYYEKDASFEQRLGNVEAYLQKDIQELDAIDKRSGVLLDSRGLWQELKSAWQKIQGQEVVPGSFGNQSTQHAFHKQVIAFIAKVGDTSNLILDPDLDSYYLMDAFVNKLPLALDQLDDLRSQAIKEADRDEIYIVHDQFFVSSLYGGFETTLMLMQRGFKTAFDYNPSLKPVLETAAGDCFKASFALLKALSGSAMKIKPAALSPADYYAEISNVMDRIFELHQVITPQLESLLEIRINGFKTRKLFVEFLACIMLMGVVYFTIAFYLSVRNTVSKLDMVAESLSVNVPISEIVLENRDELGEVAKAFNKIGIKLKESYIRLEAVNETLEKDILKRALAEEEVKTLNKELELRVGERTAELDRLNEELRRDIRRRQEIEKNLWVQYSITRCVAESSSLKEVSSKILEVICDNGNWDIGIFWKVEPGKGALACASFWHVASCEAEELKKISLAAALSGGMGLAGRIWQQNAPLWIDELAKDNSSPLTVCASKMGLRQEFGFPIHLGNEVVGVFEFLGRQILKPDNVSLAMFDAIGDQVAQFMKRNRVEEEVQKLSQSVEQSPSCVVITDTLGTIEYVNPKFTQMTGYTLQEAIGKNPRVLKSGKMPQETYARLWQTISAGKEWRGELQNKKKNGEIYWEFASISPLFDSAGSISHFVAVKEDITRRKVTEQHLGVQYTVTRLLQIVCENLEWDTGAIWLIDQSAHLMRCAETWHMPLLDVAEFEEITHTITFIEGVGLPGRIWKDNIASWIGDVTKDKNFPRAHFAAKVGLHGAFGFPIRVDTAVVGVFEFFSRQLREPDNELLAMFDSIGDQVGHLIKRTRAEDALRQLNESLALRIEQGTAQLQNSYKELREANEFNKLLIGTIPFGMDIVDEDGTILFLSQKLEETVGKQAVGNKCWLAYKDNKERCPECPLMKNILQGKTEILEVNGMLGEKIFQISHTAMAYKNKQAILEIFEDITERKNAEKRIRLFSEIAIAVSSAPDIAAVFSIVLKKVCEVSQWHYGEMWVPDKSGEYLECSSSWYSSNGHFDIFRDQSVKYRFQRGEGLPGRAWNSKKPEVIIDLAQDVNFPRKKIASEVGLKSGIAIPILAGEEVVSIMGFLSTKPCDEETSNFVWAVALQLGSIIRRKQIEEELKKAYYELTQTQSQLVHSAKMASIGQLAAGVAHEINNPLTGVLNNAQLIRLIMEQKNPLTIDEFKDIVGVIEHSALRCKKITQSLLNFSHISTGEFKQVSLSKIIEEVVNLIEYEMRLQNITLEKMVQADLPDIMGDAQLLEQVIFDALANARWAIQQKKQKERNSITISAAYPGEGKVLLTIADTGIGIPEENLSKVFEPFFTTKAVGEGTGLGLSIIYGVIKKHNGIITVESQVDVGTTIKIAFPSL